MSIKLYEISQAYQMLLEMEELEEGYLEGLQEQAEEKLSNIGVVYKTLSAEAEAIKSEEKKLAERRKAIENKAERLKQYALDNMKTLGLDKIKSPVCELSLAKNPPKLVITNQELIESRFKTEKIVIDVDNALIKEELKNGVLFEWAELVQEKSVRIK